MVLKCILGNLPAIRILDFFIDNPLDNPLGDYTRAEIAHYTQVGPTAMKRDFQLMVRCGVVIETRKIGGVPLYALDRENEMTQSLIRFADELTEYCTNNTLEAEAVKIEEEISEEQLAELPPG